METNNQSTETTDQPALDVQELKRLVGTWQLSGDTEGTLTYEWLEGGFFLVQQFNFMLFGHPVKGMEVIGHWRPFGEEPSPEIRSRAYSSLGETLNYVYEQEGDVLTIWGGEKGSPAYYKGQFSADGNTVSGEWVWPGGGYQSTMTRID